MKKLIAIVVFCLSASLASAEPKEIKVKVHGMVCSFCAQGLKKTFSMEPAVKSVKVTLEDKTIALTLKEGEKMTDEQIKKLITDVGYDVDSISR